MEGFQSRLRKSTSVRCHCLLAPTVMFISKIHISCALQARTSRGSSDVDDRELPAGRWTALDVTPWRRRLKSLRPVRQVYTRYGGGGASAWHHIWWKRIQTARSAGSLAADHCPAHVHARHRGEGWIARVRFSYLVSTVELISIVPVKNVPLQRVVNRLLSDVQVRLPDCRRSWWLTRRTTCLANQ
jgi:hypothetical protein